MLSSSTIYVFFCLLCYTVLSFEMDICLWSFSAAAILAGPLKQDILCHDMLDATEIESQSRLFESFSQKNCF